MLYCQYHLLTNYEKMDNVIFGNPLVEIPSSKVFEIGFSSTPYVERHSVAWYSVLVANKHTLFHFPKQMLRGEMDKHLPIEIQ